MKWLRQNLPIVGAERISAHQAVAILVLIAGAVFAISYEAQSVLGLSFALAAVTVGFLLELMASRARQVRRQTARLWPIVLDSLESAAVSGLLVVDAIRDLAESAPDAVLEPFVTAAKQLDAGVPVASVLDELKASFADANSDQTFELLRVAVQSGGQALVEGLRSQAADMRADFAVSAEVSAKQGWIVGTAKMAIIAPWVIVGLLSIRSENAEIYNSAAGTSMLIGGLMVSVVAYRLITKFGRLAELPRVFA